MAKIAALFALVVLSIPLVAWCDDAPATQPAATQPATNPAATAKDAKATIDEALVLMDKKDYDGVLERFIPPDELKRMKDEGAFEQTKTEFAKKHDDLAQALQQCKAKDPVVVSDTEVTYKLTGSEPELKLIKVDGKWYIK